MKKERFSVEQIVGVLKQAEVGVPVVELIRKAGISEQTFYRWKAKYVGNEKNSNGSTQTDASQLDQDNMMAHIVPPLAKSMAVLPEPSNPLTPIRVEPNLRASRSIPRLSVYRISQTIGTGSRTCLSVPTVQLLAASLLDDKRDCARARHLLSRGWRSCFRAASATAAATESQQSQ